MYIRKYATFVSKAKEMHVAVAGNIGSGKTTLTTLLSKNYGWRAHYEDVDHNPYLDDFYDDMKRWSFNLQIYFLNTRFHQVLKIRESEESVIQDRSIYEDAYIFAANLRQMNLMSNRDYDNYETLFELMAKLVQPPDLMIYLRASVPTLVRQIQKRGRDYEAGIRLDYLKRLNEMYDAWIASYNLGKLLIIDVDTTNFAENTSDLSKVIDKIDAEFNGLF